MMDRLMPSSSGNPWKWVPSLYFAQGMPYVIVMTVAVIMFKRLGMSNTDIALYTGGLYLPWVIKPFWSPLVDLLKTKRWWIVGMQLTVGAGLGGVALTLEAPDGFRYTLAFLWLLAFSSATHDIAADGFYMFALDEKRQAYFVGIRNTFYRLAVIAGQGGLVMLAAALENRYAARMSEAEAVPQAWALAFYCAAAVFGLFFLYHYIFLPHPPQDVAPAGGRATWRGLFREFVGTFASFFRKKGILPALSFILLYRFAESQLVKITSPFLLDGAEAGGLALSTSSVGFIYGTIGVVALTAGGILGGMVMARIGFRRSLWGMTCAMNLPNLVYLYLAFARPESVRVVAGCVALEQFGYGFGFTALTYFMMLFSAGRQQTAHYALCTGFMALGMMLPGMASGWIQELVGYRSFFVWIMIATLPSFLAARAVARRYETDCYGR